MPSKKKHSKRNLQKSSQSTSSPPLPSDHNFPSLPSSTATPEPADDRDSDSINTSLTSSPIIPHSAPTALPNHNMDQSFAEKAKQPPIDQIVRKDGVLDPPLNYTPTLHDPKENHHPQSPKTKPKTPSDGVRVLKLNSTYENANQEQVHEANEENATDTKDSDQKPPQSHTQKSKKKKKAHVDTDHKVASSTQDDSNTRQKKASRESKPEQESSSNQEGSISSEPNHGADSSSIRDAERSPSGGVVQDDDTKGSHPTPPQSRQKKTSSVHDPQQHPQSDSKALENPQTAENLSAEETKSRPPDSHQSAHSSTKQHSKHEDLSTTSESHVEHGLTGSSTGDTPKLSPSSISEAPSSIPELSDREPDNRDPHKGTTQKSSTSEHQTPTEKTEGFQHAERSWRQLSETAHRKVKPDDQSGSRSDTGSDSKPSLVWMYLSYFDRDGDGIFDPNDSFSTIRQLGFNPISAGLITFWVHILMWPFFGVGRGRFMIPIEVAGFSGLDSKKENQPFFEDHGKSESRSHHSDEVISPLRVFNHLGDLKDPIRFMKVVLGWMVVMSLTWRFNLSVRKEEIDGVYNGNLFDLLSHQQTV
ncbi:uncharacterized protein MELLADRAFT_78029 [Melampsora larici-populina 98AG31]|uniref:Uncharacterized protein n=1 Tax=Melampsora larici-populina (strain 98AG31 / pathotype 3-4-7) TaxID=747676 RepID=F4RPH6_MELLP|nr:uncharacterized protein MELLADRAFT_78029 [Melampsora larici-populina 98AG31]EGG05530.1 hypothetical protein MELLADRAFT_78029 [Melampsora larici-populina 98AG31]